MVHGIGGDALCSAGHQSRPAGPRAGGSGISGGVWQAWALIFGQATLLVRSPNPGACRQGR